MSISQTAQVLQYVWDYIKHRPKLWKENAEKVCDDEEDINGMVIIVTGSNTGIGKAATHQLAKRGAVVIMAVRNLEKGQEALNDIKKAGNGTSLKIELMKLDLGDLGSIRDFVKEFEQKYSHLNILVNNAGVMDTSGERKLTKDGFEQHIGVNHIGPFLLTRLLMNSLRKGAPSRVICVSSSNLAIANLNLEDLMMELKVKKGDFGREPYNISKLCNSICMQKLALSLPYEDVRIFQLCPGYVGTEMFRNDRGLIKSIRNALPLIMIGLSAHQGCETVIYLATSKSPTEGGGGKAEMYRFMKEWTTGNKILRNFLDFQKDQGDRLYRLSEKWAELAEEKM